MPESEPGILWSDFFIIADGLWHVIVIRIRKIRHHYRARDDIQTFAFLQTHLLGTLEKQPLRKKKLQLAG